MLFKVFLSAIFLLSLENSHSKNPIQGELLWGKGEVLNSPYHSELNVTEDSRDNYFIFDIKKMKLDFSTDNFYFTYRIGLFSHMAGIELRFLEKKSDENYYKYILPLFTDYEFNISKSYSWNKYGISLNNLKIQGQAPKEINYIGFYVGVNKPPFVFGIKELSKKARIKKGIATITFDDGYLSQLKAAQITAKYGLKGTAYIMPRDVGKKDILSLKQIKQMKKLGWDIQSHHKDPITWMNEDELKAEIQFGKNYLRKKELEKNSRHFAYPLGKQLPHLIDNVIRKEFKTARIAGGGIETLPPANNYQLRAFNVLNSTTAEELKKVIADTKKNGGWLILMLHYLKEKPETELEYTPKNFEKLCNLLKESNIKVMTVDEVYKKYLK